MRLLHMNILIYDNGGKTPDRYCVVVDNKKVYTMGLDDLSKGGIRYLCEAVDLDRGEAGRPIRLTELPEELRRLFSLKGLGWFRKEAA